MVFIVLYWKVIPLLNLGGEKTKKETTNFSDNSQFSLYNLCLPIFSISSIQTHYKIFYVIYL